MRARKGTWGRLNEDAEPLWEAYKDDPCEDNRNALVTHYYPFARFVALQRRQKLATDVQTDIDDLIANASMALIDAVERYDPGRGTAFTSYATQRLSGAIIDGIREMDWVPRLVRTAQREGRENPVGMGSLDAVRFTAGGNGETQTLFDVIEVMGRSERRRRMEGEEFWAEATKGFTKTEKLLLMLYYQDDMTMKEIGQSIGLSESRVSQMHSSIIREFRERRWKNVRDHSPHAGGSRTRTHRANPGATQREPNEGSKGTRNQHPDPLQPPESVRTRTVKKRATKKRSGGQDRVVLGTPGRRVEKRVDRKPAQRKPTKSGRRPAKGTAVRPRKTR